MHQIMHRMEYDKEIMLNNLYNKIRWRFIKENKSFE